VPALQKSFFVFICVHLRSSVDNISFAFFALFASFAANIFLIFSQRQLWLDSRQVS